MFADATALARDFVGDRQFNLGFPRMILTNVSWTSEVLLSLCPVKTSLENKATMFLAGFAEPGAAEGKTLNFE